MIFPFSSIYVAFLNATWYGSFSAPIFSIPFILNILQFICDSPNANSPFSSNLFAISSLISVYSTTLGLPFFKQNTPTFSLGFALTTDLPALIAFCSSESPIKTSSTICAKGLSTGPIKIHSIFLFFMSSTTPFLNIDSKTPPCPSAASLTVPCSFKSTFPEVLSIGNSP